MTYTPDQVAADIISEGKSARTTGTPETLHPVISPRGIQIALSTAIVESNDRVLANPNVPESENFPNDGDGYDHDSAGAFQQQFMWWGTVAEEMDPRLSAAMFYHHLAGMDYNDPDTSPGTFAQDVQQSAFPTRYDAVFDQAVAQYNRLTSEAPVSPASNITANAPAFNYQNWVGRCPNYQGRSGTRIDLVLLHTQEGDGTAEDLANFLINSANTGNPVSYHRTIDNAVTVVDVVAMPEASWSVMNSNDRSINMCFAGSTVNWSRDEWLANMGDGIDVAAYLAVLDCHAWGIPLNVIPGPDYNSDPPGISDHRYCSDYLQDGNSHTDVGNNFPWDVFADAVAKYSGTPLPPPPPPPSGSQTYTVESGDTLDGIADQFGVTESALRAANPSITNPDLIFPGQVLNIPGGNS
jgi:nucleoid-associated protein YgaU